ncbi:hypothetical protein [Stutzerimonas kunmingensis]|jgi:hypothetical protein|uniref:hypothetical protein n=1 Tax=Stutzerimonas kunmingensis TaxID=1211807 RepID=UPI00255D72EE|nr:hypothetical protein [Stutzerimonas kunmingensis]WOF77650.1 hypothetical protein P5704_016555 [Pseudomonas sp. FeN3W]
MDLELLSVLVSVGVVLAGLLAYLIYSALASGFEARRQAEQAAKERRWAAAFERLEGRELECEPEPALPNSWWPVVRLCGGVLALVLVPGLFLAWQDNAAREAREAERDARWAAEDQQAAIRKQRADPVEQRRELAWFGMRAAGLPVDLAAVKNVPGEAETRELVATGINLNGHLCARVTAIRPLKLDGGYEIECIEYRGGSTTKTYIIHAGRGFAFVPGAAPGSTEGWIRP